MFALPKWSFCNVFGLILVILFIYLKREEIPFISMKGRKGLGMELH